MRAHLFIKGKFTDRHSCQWNVWLETSSTSIGYFSTGACTWKKAVYYHNKRGKGGSCIKGSLGSTLQTTLVLALKSLWNYSSTLSTAVGATYSSSTLLTLNTSLQCSMSLHAINKSCSVTCGSQVKKSDSLWKWAEWAGIRRWGQEWLIYIKRGAESLPALSPLPVT